MSPQKQRGLTLAGLLTLAVTVVVLASTSCGSDGQRNYGGWTSALRWLIWLTPLWLVTLLPVADWLAGAAGAECWAIFCWRVSVISVSYPQYSPWRHPWVYNFLEAHGLIKY